jgi:transcriptional regulator with XRE-family HTH domain
MGQPDGIDGEGELAGSDGEGRGAIGRRVRIARELADLRAMDLAVQVKRIPHTVYRWEGGHVDPSLPDCRKIAAATGCSLSWLLTGEGAPRSAAA